MKYRNLENGRIEIVKNVDGAIAELVSGERISVSRLKDPRYFEAYTPDVNVNNNVGTTIKMNESVMDNSVAINLGNENSRYQNILKGFQENRKADISIRPDNDVSQSLSNTDYSINNPGTEIKFSNSVVESHNEHNRKMGINEPKRKDLPRQQPQTNIHNTISVSGELTEEQRRAQEAELLQKYGTQINTQQSNTQQNNTQQNTESKNVSGQTLADIEANVNSRNTQTQQPQQPKENPVHKMFDKAKKVHPLKVTLKINEKIPNKEVIKMMEENFDESAIDYFATDIYKKLMKDPKIIEDQVREAIEKYVKSRSKT
jgi:hypothetical protein